MKNKSFNNKIVELKCAIKNLNPKLTNEEAIVELENLCSPYMDFAEYFEDYITKEEANKEVAVEAIVGGLDRVQRFIGNIDIDKELFVLDGNLENITNERVKILKQELLGLCDILIDSEEGDMSEDIVNCTFKDEAIEAYQDWAEDLNARPNDITSIQDFIMGLQYEIFDNVEDIAEAENIINMVENILIKHFIVNSANLIK